MNPDKSNDMLRNCDLKNHWNNIAQIWQNTRPQLLWRRHSDTVNIELLNCWLPERKVSNLLKTDLFDEAICDGLYRFLKSRAENVVGVDISSLTVQGAKSFHHTLRGAAADVRSLPFADGAFDIIVSNSTLDHFETEHEMITGLRELRRVLRRGGKLIVTLDNLGNPIIALRNSLPFRLMNYLGIVPYFVGSTLSSQGLSDVLHELDFEVIEVRSIMHFPRVIAVPVGNVLDKYCAAQIQTKFLRLLMSFESFSKLPTQFITGHFVAAKAVKL